MKLTDLEKIINVKYTKSKIIADPLGYSLKDKVVFHNQDNLLCNYTSDSETILYGRVMSALHISLIKIDPIITYKAKIERGTIPLFKTNNLNFYLEGFLQSFYSNYTMTKGMSNTELKDYLNSSNSLDSLFYLINKLTSSQSVIKELFSLKFTLADMFNYKDIYELNYLKEALNTPKDVSLLIANSTINDSSLYYTPCIYNVDSISDLMTVNDNIFSSLDPALESIAKLLYRDTLIYGIEILYQYNKIELYDIKNTLKELLIYNYKDSDICKDLYIVKDNNLIINEEVKKCFIDNNEQRFNKIKEFIKNYDAFDFKNIIKDTLTVVDKIQNDHSSFHTTTFAAPIFAILVNFCNYYSMLQQRILQNQIFYAKALELKLNVTDILSSETDIYDEDKDIENDEDSDEDENYHNKTDFLNHTFGNYTDTEKFKDSNSGYKSLETVNEMEKFTSSQPKYNYDLTYIPITKDLALKEAYYKIADKLKTISPNFIRQIQEIKTYNTGGKEPGLPTGKLDKKNVYKYRQTSKIFCKNTYKIKESDLAFGILLDISGSMSGEGIKNGKLVMILLHEVLKSLKINHCIAGHTSHGTHNCIIEEYQSFKENPHYNVNKNYNLVNLKAKFGNCDSGALNYMYYQLAKVKNKDKICLIFSDGAPTECTDSELINQVKFMENKGIVVIGIGINFPSIERYYTKHANGKNLVDMLNITINILKEYVLKKGD